MQQRTTTTGNQITKYGHGRVLFIKSPVQTQGRRNSNKLNNKRRKRTGRKKRSKKQEGGNLIVRNNPRFPSAIKQMPIHNRVIRYIIGSTLTDQGITPRDLLRQLSSVVNGSTAVTAIIGSIKLRRVSLYFVTTDGTFGTGSAPLAFQWQGAMNAPEEIITDRGTATQPACIKVVPPLESLAGFFFDPNSNDFTDNIFIFSAAAGTVIDIEFDFIMPDGAGHTGTLASAATLTGVIIPNLAGNSNIDVDGGVSTGRWT
jgi:hypothetical protein